MVAQRRDVLNATREGLSKIRLSGINRPPIISLLPQARKNRLGMITRNVLSLAIRNVATAAKQKIPLSIAASSMMCVGMGAFMGLISNRRMESTIGVRP